MTKTYSICIERDSDPSADFARYQSTAGVAFTNVTLIDDSHAEYAEFTFDATDAAVIAYATTFDAAHAIWCETAEDTVESLFLV